RGAEDWQRTHRWARDRTARCREEHSLLLCRRVEALSSLSPAGHCSPALLLQPAADAWPRSDSRGLALLLHSTPGRFEFRPAVLLLCSRICRRPEAAGSPVQASRLCPADRFLREFL